MTVQHTFISASFMRAAFFHTWTYEHEHQAGRTCSGWLAHMSAIGKIYSPSTVFRSDACCPILIDVHTRFNEPIFSRQL